MKETLSFLCVPLERREEGIEYLMIEKINNELLNIINEGEGVTTEFKEASNKLPRNLFETVCAFLNRNGGNIFLGVSDNGEITGVNTEKIN